MNRALSFTNTQYPLTEATAVIPYYDYGFVKNNHVDQVCKFSYLKLVYCRFKKIFSTIEAPESQILASSPSEGIRR